MIDQNYIYEKIISLLDDNLADYRLFSHKEALTYSELEEVQKEAGFSGAEMKCMVLKADTKLIVYITLQGNRLSFDAIKERLKVKKVRLSTEDELKEYFGAKPGCAYPFGFDSRYDIYVNPRIYEEEWLLFSPLLATKTIQTKGSDLKKILDSLENKVEEALNFDL
ncbi:MAG: YbaK/EbsC family protein [Patescibacteria group bacterium]